MKLDEKLYKSFLEEMNDLESFRLAYAAAHPATPLDRDDPDVKRLTEALAFFSARTRTAGLRTIESVHRRLFQQFVPFLLSPLPAMGMLQAAPTGQFSESVTFPRGSEVAVAPENGKSALFRTLHDLRVLPLSAGRAEMLPLPRGGTRLVLPLSVPYPRNDEIGELNIHINHLNDFQASLRVFDLLQQYLLRTSVVFEDRVDEASRGAPCETSFGATEPEEDDDCPHPLQRERSFFFYPQASLYLNVRVPEPPRNWSRVALCFDLDAKWPRDLRLSREVFRLFVVPIVNLHRATAAPMICDGTKERFAIRHPALAAGFAPHSVRGVYRIENGALIPLLSGTVSSGSGTYEVEEEVDAEGTRRHWLHLHLPEAFARPRTISLDGLWLQPWFSSLLGQKLQAAPYRRAFPGLKWELVGETVPHQESGFADSTDSFLHLFVLQNKTVMNRDDLDLLLQALSSVWSGPYGQLRDQLTGLRVEEVPLKGGGSGGSALKLVYHLTFAEAARSMESLVKSLVLHTGRILDAWISDATVEARMEIAS
jgi:type VI secretion system protein ImpG